MKNRLTNAHNGWKVEGNETFGSIDHLKRTLWKENCISVRGIGWGSPGYCICPRVLGDQDLKGICEFADIVCSDF